MLTTFVESFIGGLCMSMFFNWGLRALVHWFVSLSLPPKPTAPTVAMEFDDMAKFRVRFGVVSARSDELDPTMKLTGRRFDYAVNDGDVVSTNIGHLSSAEVVVEGLDPGNTVAVQLFNVDADGRLSEPAEVLVTIPTPTPPAVLPVPTEPTFVVEEVPVDPVV